MDTKIMSVYSWDSKIVASIINNNFAIPGGPGDISCLEMLFVPGNIAEKIHTLNLIDMHKLPSDIGLRIITVDDEVSIFTKYCPIFVNWEDRTAVNMLVQYVLDYKAKFCASYIICPPGRRAQASIIIPHLQELVELVIPALLKYTDSARRIKYLHNRLENLIPSSKAFHRLSIDMWIKFFCPLRNGTTHLYRYWIPARYMASPYKYMSTGHVAAMIYMTGHTPVCKDVDQTVLLLKSIIDDYNGGLLEMEACHKYFFPCIARDVPLNIQRVAWLTLRDNHPECYDQFLSYNWQRADNLQIVIPYKELSRRLYNLVVNHGIGAAKDRLLEPDHITALQVLYTELVPDFIREMNIEAHLILPDILTNEQRDTICTRMYTYWFQNKHSFPNSEALSPILETINIEKYLMREPPADIRRILTADPVVKRIVTSRLQVLTDIPAHLLSSVLSVDHLELLTAREFMHCQDMCIYIITSSNQLISNLGLSYILLDSIYGGKLPDTVTLPLCSKVPPEHWDVWLQNTPSFGKCSARGSSPASDPKCSARGSSPASDPITPIATFLPDDVQMLIYFYNKDLPVILSDSIKQQAFNYCIEQFVETNGLVFQDHCIKWALNPDLGVIPGTLKSITISNDIYAPIEVVKLLYQVWCTHASPDKFIMGSQALRVLVNHKHDISAWIAVHHGCKLNGSELSVDACEDTIRQLVDKEIIDVGTLERDILIKLDLNNCPVCLVPMQENQTVIVSPCNHVFHGDCIAMWLQQRNTGNKCPMCRTVITGSRSRAPD